MLTIRFVRINPFNCSAANDGIFNAKLLCAAAALLLLTTNCAYAQPIISNLNSTLTHSIFLQTQVLGAAPEKPEHGELNTASIDTLVQRAGTQSLIGKYEDAIRSLEQALELSRIHNGLYHYSQIEIVEELIANEVLRENWEAVDSFYDLEEHLLRRLFDSTDARLEVGLERITAWHIRAINEDIDNDKHEHFAKVLELLTIRLTVVENLLGSDNARYNFILSNLAYAELELEKFRLRRMSGAGTPMPQHTPMKIE